MAKVGSREEWTAARTALLAEEKAHLRAGDALAAKRRALPWVKMGKYVFEGPKGEITLEQLFGKKSQLVVYHFMFPPEDKEGCPHCSFWADQFDGAPVHLAARDAAFTAISRAPIAKIEKFKKRMGWSFPWVSSGANQFNYDLGVSFTDEQLADGTAVYNFKPLDMEINDREGISTFAKDKRGVFHVYSTFARGIEPVNGAYAFMDMLPRGRDEGGESQSWVRYHDRYED